VETDVSHGEVMRVIEMARQVDVGIISFAFRPREEG